MKNIFAKIKTEEQLKIIADRAEISSVILEPDFLHLYSKSVPETDSNNLFKATVNMINASGKNIYISLPYILRESILDKLKGVIGYILDEDMVQGFSVNNIDSIGLLKEKGNGKEILAGEFLYSYNNVSIDVITSLAGKTRFISIPELTIDEMKTLQKNTGENFIYKIYGRQILMVTAQDMIFDDNKKIMDFKNKNGESFLTCFDKENGYSLVYNWLSTYMMDRIKELPSDDIMIDFTIENKKDVNMILDELASVLAGNEQRAIFNDRIHTRGHYYRNIF